MKGKILVLALAAIGISANSFAVEIYKGRVIDHKEWTTGSAKGAFKVDSITRASNLNAKKLGPEGSSYTYSEISSAKGTVGTPSSITGSSMVSFGNFSEQTKQYNYMFSVCASTDDHVENCLFYHDTIEIEPNGYFYTSMTPELKVSFDKPGTFKIVSFTNFSEDQSANYGGSGSTSTIEIS